MTTRSELRNDIDRLWDKFWQGGISNPLTVIEQITYLMFIRLMDMNEMRQEKMAARTGKEVKSHFNGPDDPRRWSNLLNVGSEESLKTLRDDVFPHFKKLAGSESTFGQFMTDATLMINKPELLRTAMRLINDLPLEQGDLKGDIYEYMLSKLSTAGVAGQFRTPRHIIRMMVEMVEPTLEERVADPAAGTAGFLCSVVDYLNEKHSSPDGTIEHIDEEDGSKSYSYLGDEIDAQQREHMRTDMFGGMDFDVSMLQIAAMNLMLHGIDNPQLHFMDTLSSRFPDQLPDLASDAFDVILANPPFKGAIDIDLVHRSLSSKLKTKKTELLFPLLMLRMLKLGGRCACIVPDGVLFGSSKAHVALRQMLIEDHNLEAVISMPSGVFKPYAGVSTAIIIFQRTDSGGTGQEIAKSAKTGIDDPAVWFYHMEQDGYSLDDKRTETPDQNDVPDAVERFHARLKEDLTDRTGKHFAVPVDEIKENAFDLSINRYKEVVYEAVEYDPPKVILKRLADLDDEIAKGRKELEGMLG